MTDDAPVERARQIIRDLYDQHGITDPAQAKRLIRERFSQTDIDAYKAALKVLDGSGSIG